MLKKSVRINLERLGSDLTAYRLAMDRIFSKSLSRPSDCREYFFDLLVCVTRIYLDYLLLGKELSKIPARRIPVTNLQPKAIKLDSNRAKSLQDRFKERLRSQNCWQHFRPDIPFAELTGLHTASDFMKCFTVDLPEIYEETLRAKQYVKRLLEKSGESGTSLAVSLEHLCRNHVSTVMQALQWASDESTWP